jgi:N-acetylmuramoyl-L-alanine amidase
MRLGRLPAGILATWAVLLLGAAASAQAADIKALRIWEGPDYTRAVFDVSGPLDYKLFELSDPGRIVIDVRDGRIAEGLGAPAAKGMLKAVRIGKQGKNDARIVLDLGAEVRPKSFLLPPAEKLGYRLVVDLYPKQKPAPVKTVKQVLPGEPRPVVIAIDAGHGGEDPGALGATGSHEKNITLQVARELKRQIDREPGMSAILTRDGDYYVKREDRYRKAREARADLFVSIHADACPGSCETARGSSVWVLSTRGASSEAARRLADRENRADLIGGVSLDDKEDSLAAVLLDLQQGATMDASNAVAEHVLVALRQIGPTHRRQVERANFVVLRSPDVPSILVETAFISNPAEEKRLKDPSHREKLAAAIVDGARNYFRMMPPQGTWFAANADKFRPSRHVVGRGETLAIIAERHGVTPGKLRSANKLASDSLRVGDVLDIPAG